MRRLLGCVLAVAFLAAGCTTVASTEAQSQSSTESQRATCLGPNDERIDCDDLGVDSNLPSVPQEPAETQAASDDALQEYIRNSREAVEAEFERFGDVYSDFSVYAEGTRTLVYRYTFREQVDPANNNLDQVRGTLESLADDVILPEMRSAGIDSPAVKWIYYNADGTYLGAIEATS